MDILKQPYTIPNLPYKFIFYILVTGMIVGLLVKFMLDTPPYQYNEGFGGIARGSGQPDSLRTLPEGSEILDVLHKSGASDRSGDYKEFQLILSKLGSLKKDLMSASGIVEATRYQSFDTTHDRINVAELCGMCLNKSVSARDLDIIFATWRDRGKMLLTKLCTQGNLKEEGVVRLETLFNTIWTDVYDISKNRCLISDYPTHNGGDAGPYIPKGLQDLRTYDYKYGGLSASGSNGAV